MDIFALQQIINRIPLLKFRYLGSFPSDFVPTLDNDIFAIINTQPSNMQGEYWIMIAEFGHELYFADSLGRIGVQFSQQPALQADDTNNPTVSPKCMRLLYNICSFSSLQIPTRRNYSSSRC